MTSLFGTRDDKPVLAVAISAAGDLVAAGSLDGSFRVKDLASGRERIVPAGAINRICSIGVSRNGEWAMTGAASGDIRLWDLKAGRCSYVQRATREFASVCVSANGLAGLTSGGDPSIVIWNLVRHTCEGVVSHIGGSGCVAISDTGHVGVSGGEDGSIAVFDLTVQRLTGMIEGNGKSVFCIATTADGSIAATGSQDGTIRIHDLHALAVLDEFRAHSGPVVSIALSPKGDLIISGGGRRDDSVRIWDSSPVIKALYRDRFSPDLHENSKKQILESYAKQIAARADVIYRDQSEDCGIDAEIEHRHNVQHGEVMKLYLQLKCGDSYLRPRRDGTVAFDIDNDFHKSYWQKHRYPVMLVICTSDGNIRWMNITNYLLSQRPSQGELGSRVVVFEGERFTPEAIQRVFARWSRLSPPTST
jgi:WD40 repeat protein